MHEVLRATTIEHMKDSADFYRQYMAVNNVRRNPKRKTAAAAAAAKCMDTSYYTQEQLQQQFEHHVEKMGQPGEWADNMEVSAFASALNVNVRLWQADYTYLFSPRTCYSPDADPAADDSRQTLHIAYHVSCRLPPLLPRPFSILMYHVIDLGTLLVCPQYRRPPHRHSQRQCRAKGYIQEASKSQRRRRRRRSASTLTQAPLPLTPIRLGLYTRGHRQLVGRVTWILGFTTVDHTDSPARATQASQAYHQAAWTPYL